MLLLEGSDLFCCLLPPGGSHEYNGLERLVGLAEDLQLGIGAKDGD